MTVSSYIDHSIGLYETGFYFCWHQYDEIIIFAFFSNHEFPNMFTLYLLRGSDFRFFFLPGNVALHCFTIVEHTTPLEFQRALLVCCLVTHVISEHRLVCVICITLISPRASFSTENMAAEIIPTLLTNIPPRSFTYHPVSKPAFVTQPFHHISTGLTADYLHSTPDSW